MGDHLKAREAEIKALHAEVLEVEKKRYDLGVKKSILTCLCYCLKYDEPIPRWCKDAYIGAIEQVEDCRARHWSDVFGRAHPKGAHLKPKSDLFKEYIAVYDRISERIANGEAVDGHLFESVGRELGIGGKTKIEQYYYKVKKWNEME